MNLFKRIHSIFIDFTIHTHLSFKMHHIHSLSKKKYISTMIEIQYDYTILND